MKWIVIRACLIPASLLLAAQAPDTGKSPFWDNFAFERGTRDITLDAAQRMGVFNSLIKDPLDLDIDDAEADIEIAKSNFDPVLTLNSNLADSDQSAFDTETRTKTGSATVSKLFATGTTVSVSQSYTETDTDSLIATSDGESDSLDTTVALNQPLLKNAGTLVNTLARETAKIDLDSAELQKLATLTSNYRDVTTAYWNHWIAFRNLEIAIEQFDLANQQKELAEKLLGAGLVAAVEVLRAEAGIAQRIDAILAAQDNLIITNNALFQLISDEEGAGDLVLLNPVTEPSAEEPTLSISDVSDAAIESSLALKILQNEVDVAALTVRAADWQTLPELDLNLSYTKSKVDKDASLIAVDDSEDWAVGVTLTYPLFERNSHAQLRQARNSNHLARKNVAIQRQGLRKTSENLVSNLFQNYRRLLAARREVDVTRRIYEAELKQFDRGARTSTDVLDVATQLSLALTKQSQAYAQYEISRTEIALLMGQVGDRVRRLLKGQE
ncbi:TolC family protein [Hwanghaeella grinnelliae]|uniref:TolC family protein n=1 Tax=Hwanghaeella grinnelliae TaxID=2500179 RepID=A0A3S2Z4Z8_9PROT|nr:TolC family protein [Hwanghaeella grinnelliae]RVU33964.1 TolC family protein [Hwanghaeella grinnelliae]